MSSVAFQTYLNLLRRLGLNHTHIARTASPQGTAHADRKRSQRLLIRGCMVQRMVYRQRCFYGSQGKIAEATGLSLATVKRRMREMESDDVPADERIRRTGEMSCRWGKLIPVYTVPGRRLCTSDLQSTTCRTTTSTSTTTKLTLGRAWARYSPPRSSGRRRRIIENAEHGTDVVRKDGTITTFNAGDAVAAIVDSLKIHGVRLPPAWRGILGRHTKALLDDGYPPEEVVAAGVVAVRRGAPQLMQFIAGDLSLVRAGIRLDRHGYETELRTEVEAQRTSAWIKNLNQAAGRDIV